MKKNNLLRQVERFTEEVSREEYAHLIGRKSTLNTKRIYKKYSSLFSKNNIASVYNAWKISTGKIEERQNRNLYVFLVSGHIGNKLRDESDKVHNEEAKATIKVDGKKIAYRNASGMIINEDNRKKRKQIFNACTPVRRKLTSLERPLLIKEYKMLKGLTGHDYVSFYKWYKQVDYDAFAKELVSFLKKTDAVYERQIRKLFSSINVKLEDAEQHDLSYLIRAKQFDAYFPKKHLLATLDKFLKGIGFILSKQKSIEIDSEERPKKVPRAFCYPIRVPEEVKLVIKPHGGQGDYQTILHEAGHTEHYANTDEHVAYELKHMGPHSVSESYAFLFEYLMTDPLWLQKYVGMPAKIAKEFSEFLMLEKLFFFRRYAAKVLYELKLHRKDMKRYDNRFRIVGKKYSGLPAMYADILGKATKIKYTKENYLLDVDSGFYSADYARAWMMEVILRKSLQKKIGRRWWAKKSTGKFLKQFWRYGSSGVTIEEISSGLKQKFGLKPLADEFNRFF